MTEYFLPNSNAPLKKINLKPSIFFLQRSKNRANSVIMKIRFYLNDAIVYSSEPKELLSACLSYPPNINYWSYDAILNLLAGSIENTQVFCRAKIAELKSSKDSASNQKVAINRLRYFIRWSNKLLEHLPSSQEQLLIRLFNVVLACDGFGLLRGFGMSNKHGDKLRGNPEFSSIYDIEPFESFVQRKVKIPTVQFQRRVKK